MQYRILCKFKPGDDQEKYWVQSRKHWWNRWTAAPVMAYWCHYLVMRGYAYVKDESIARFIKENLIKHVQRYKDFTIYPVFNWSVDNEYSWEDELYSDSPLVFSYKIKGFTCLYRDYENSTSSDIIQHIWETVDEVKEFIDELKNSKEKIKTIK